MSEEHAGSLLQLIRDNSQRTIPGAEIRAHAVEVGNGLYHILIAGEGWYVWVVEDNEPARKMLVTLCLELGTMIATGEYAERGLEE